MFRMFRLLFLVLLVLILSVSLLGCGGGSSRSTSDTTSINNAFTSINLTADTILGDYSTNDDSAAVGSLTVQSFTQNSAPGSWSWGRYQYVNVTMTKNVTNITVNGDSATADGSFILNGQYIISGTKSDGTAWSYTKDFTLTGEGTVNFLKINGVWRVDNIPQIVLKNDPANSPTVDPIVHLATVTAGQSFPVSTTVTSVQTAGQHILFYIATRSYGGFPVAWPVIDTNPSVSYSKEIQTRAAAYIGNHYGAIVAYQLVDLNSNPANPDYKLFLTINISSIKVIAP